MQTHEWEELLYESPADHLPGKRAVAEVIRLRKAIADLRDDYIHMCYGIAADNLTRILEGDNHE